MSVVVNCAWCGKEKQTYPSRIKTYKETSSNFYCDRECKKAYWSSHRIGENNPKHKERVSVKCSHCGTDFKIDSWRINKSQNHFCSIQCKGKWTSSNCSGISSKCYKKETHIKKECYYCGKEISVLMTQHIRYKNSFCSRECADNHKKNKPTGRYKEYHTSICAVCGESFKQPKNTKFQRKTCYNGKCRHILKGITKNNHVVLICKYCGKEYSVHNCEKERSSYCGRTCRALDLLIKDKCDTAPELIVENYLTSRKIGYTKQEPISNKFKVDFYIPPLNIIIEVQGDYWHSNPVVFEGDNLTITQKQNIKKDRAKYMYLTKCGYIVFGIWEKDIKRDIKKALEPVFTYMETGEMPEITGFRFLYETEKAH